MKLDDYFFGTSNPSTFAAKEAIVFCIYSLSIYYYFFSELFELDVAITLTLAGFRAGMGMCFRLVLNFCRVGQGILWRVMGSFFLNNYFLNARKIRRAIIGLEIGTF